MLVEKRVSCLEQNGTEEYRVMDPRCHLTRNYHDCQQTVSVPRATAARGVRDGVSATHWSGRKKTCSLPILGTYNLTIKIIYILYACGRWNIGRNIFNEIQLTGHSGTKVLKRSEPLINDHAIYPPPPHTHRVVNKIGDLTDRIYIFGKSNFI